MVDVPEWIVSVFGVACIMVIAWVAVFVWGMGLVIAALEDIRSSLRRIANDVQLPF